MGDQVEKIMEIPGGRGSNAKPSGTENPVGWGGQTRKKPSLGGVWIFSGTTHGMVVSFSINYEQQTSYLLFVHMLIFVVP